MSADDVRRFCIENYVEPARLRGDIGVFIRAGNVHREMGLENRFPLVCDSIRTSIFSEEAHIRLVGVDGPRQGATTTFAFLLL
jgi:5-methylcytosine-specific restriction protein B